MKKIFTLASALLLSAAMLGGLTSCANTQNNASAPVAGGETAGLAIAYVNVDSLLTNYDFAKDLNEALIKKTEDARASFN